MIYSLVISRQAQKNLEKISEPDYSKIVTLINSLANAPRQSGVKKLQGRPGYRIRQGNYRIIFNIEDTILQVFIVDIGHRKDIYG